MTEIAQNQAIPVWEKPVDSLGRFMEAIEFLHVQKKIHSMPTSQSVAALLESIEKTRFKKSLEECLGIAENQPSKASQDYAISMISCISTGIASALSCIGITDIPIEIMISIGGRNGLAFRKAVQTALNKADPNKFLALQQIIRNIDNSALSLGMNYKVKVSSENGNITPIQQQASLNLAAESQETSNVPLPSMQSVEENTINTEDMSSVTTSIGMTGSDYLSTHVYGASAALCFNAALSRDGKNQTIIVDAAIVTGQDPITGKSKCDWQGAIHIQIGHKELLHLYAVLAGRRHGIKIVTKDGVKSFEIERQQSNFYVKVSDRGQKVRAVKIDGADGYHVMLIARTQIIRQLPQELREQPGIVDQMMESTVFAFHNKESLQ